MASGLRWGEDDGLLFRRERNALFEDAEPIGAEDWARSRGGRLRTPPRALLVQHGLGTVAKLPAAPVGFCILAFRCWIQGTCLAAFMYGLTEQLLRICIFRNRDVFAV